MIAGVKSFISQVGESIRENKVFYLQAILHIVVGAGTPVLAILSSSTPITARVVAAMIVGAIVGAAGTLKAFLSLTYAESPVSNFKSKS